MPAGLQHTAALLAFVAAASALQLPRSTTPLRTSSALSKSPAQDIQLPPVDSPPKGADEPSPLALIVGISAFACVEPAMASDVSWIAPTKAVLGPFLSIYTLLFLFRTVLSWFPKYDLNTLPWNIAAWPTEPILKGTRQIIPPVAGVDITPIVWVAILSFFSEILLGPQGLLTILQKKG